MLQANATSYRADIAPTAHATTGHGTAGHGTAGDEEVISLRQLRHQTKNALQRLLVQVSSCSGLQRDSSGRALAADLERRICLTASLSDALFGLTHAPGPLEERLETLCRAVIGLMADGDQLIALDVSVDEDCPVQLGDVLVRVAHELVGNAVKHGLHLRMIGRIEVRVQVEREKVVMRVVDDGWGCGEESGGDGTRRGEGLEISRTLARRHDGHVRLVREGLRTIAEVALPRPCGAVEDVA